MALWCSRLLILLRDTVLPIVMLVMLGTTIYQYFYVQKIHLESETAVVVEASPGEIETVITRTIETEKTVLVKSIKTNATSLSVNTPGQTL